MKGHLTQRKKGSWDLVIDVGVGPDGKRKQKWHRVQGTKKEAEAELARILNEMNQGTYVEPSKMTVGEYLVRWLEDYASTNVAAETYERYAGIVRQHLIPALGEHPLARLQPIHIQGYYSAALREGRIDGRGGKSGLSAQTVLHHHRVLRQALNQAVRWQLLVRNPAEAVEPPRPVKEEMKVLNPREVRQLLEAAFGTRYFLPVMLALSTGMRRGELLALRWQDLDLDRGVLSVRRSLQQTKAGLSFKEPKSARGRRLIVLPAPAVAALRMQAGAQTGERDLMGQDYQDGDLVYAEPDGSPLRPDTLSSGFRGVLRRAGIRHVRFHDLRHTHATLLLLAGIHPKVVSERLGHASVSITLDTYSHVLPSMQEDAARVLEGPLTVSGISAGVPTLLAAGE